MKHKKKYEDVQEYEQSLEIIFIVDENDETFWKNIVKVVTFVFPCSRDKQVQEGKRREESSTPFQRKRQFYKL